MNIEQKQRLRPIAREKAEWFSNQVRLAARAGGNTHRAGIDAQDVVDEFISTLPEADRESFSVLYTEEIQALASATMEETERALAAVAEQERENAAWGQIGAVVAVVVLFVAVWVAVR
ncbi:hypothetical protein [Kerstersia similis]|uniref:hypothetical protein n=1 Tax=Kerstersia similis TaxID=206505 RepID=UPI0039F0C5F5